MTGPEPSPCRPRSPAACCDACARRDDGIPVPPSLRPQQVLLDASIVPWPLGLCPLHIAAPAATPMEDSHVDAVR